MICSGVEMVNPMEYEDYDYKISAQYEGGREIQIKIERNELNFLNLKHFTAKYFCEMR